MAVRAEVMRLWYVPLEVLDDQRLIAQHHEIHMLFGMLKYNHFRTKQWDGIIYDGPHLWCLMDYHRRTVDEMAYRGYYGHQSPIPGEIHERAQFKHVECKDWSDHVKRLVKPRRIYQDVLDLGVRWAREGKEPRSALAQSLRQASLSTGPGRELEGIRVETERQDPGVQRDLSRVG